MKCSLLTNNQCSKERCLGQRESKESPCYANFCLLGVFYAKEHSKLESSPSSLDWRSPFCLLRALPPPSPTCLKQALDWETSDNLRREGAEHCFY